MIVRMKKIYLVGLASEKESFLARLQEIGLAHLILPDEPVEPGEVIKELARVTETRKFLSRLGAGAVQEEADRNYTDICRRREELGHEEAGLYNDLSSLIKEVRRVEPFGDFSLDDLALLRKKGLKIRFFKASRKALEAVSLEDCYWVETSGEGGEIALAVLSRKPLEIDLPEDSSPTKRLSDLYSEIKTKEDRLVAVREEYAQLSGQISTLAEAEAVLSDEVEYRRAAANLEAELDNTIFVVKCWSPVPKDELVERLGTDFTIYAISAEPGEAERVPVLMDNKPAVEPGEDLVKIYSYPNYDDFDPSGLVLYFFAIFFGMIVGDAGYGLCLLALTVFIHQKIKSPGPLAKRLIRQMYILSAAVIIFGVLGASYFSIGLPPSHALINLRVLDFSTLEGQNFVMLVSVMIGMIHISLSLAIHGYRRRDLSRLGWIIVIWAAYFLIKSKMGAGQDNPPAAWIMIGGLVIVFLFSSKDRNILVRIAGGVGGLLGIVQIFSDVLSYLRLFALSIATVYMAQTFNMLAGDIFHGVPWVGWLFAGLVLALGHLVNLALAVMGGVIHGLRLNFLEWYRWSFEGDGLAYKPFKRISRQG